MTFTRKLCLAGLLLLCGCGDTAADAPPLERARIALARGDGIAAEAALREVAARGGSRQELAAYFAQAELLQGNTADARGWLAPGDFAPGTAALGFRMRGRLAIADGDLAGAGRAFDRALKANPRDPDLWVDIARLRYRGGEQEQAVAAAQKALALAPRDPQALLLRAQLVRDSRGSASALPLFESALATAPDNTQLLGAYAATLGDAGRAADSLKAVRRLAKLDPGNPRILFLQSVIAARAGNYDLARSLLLRGGDAYRDMPAAILLSGVIDLESGNYASAAQTLDRLSRMQPDNRRVRALLARALALGGNDIELVHRFDGAAATPYLAALVGRAHEALGERGKAAPYLDQAARPLSGAPSVLVAATPLGVAQSRGTAQGADALALVRGLIAAHQPGAARARANEFLRRYPGSADAMGLAGDAALSAGDARSALRLYARAAEIRRPWPLARRMAAAHMQLGDFPGAERVLREYLAGDPTNAEAAALLGRAAFLRGDFARAAMLIDHAIAKGSGRDPVLHALRSEVALRLGDGGAARAQALRASKLQPANPAAVHMLALTRNAGALAQR
ncbi:MAG: tetratricopeptide repeat protein [Tsuneonella sp.]